MTYLLQARSTDRDAWVLIEHNGQHPPSRWHLPDGTDIYQLIDNGQTEDLDFVPRFVHTNTGTRLGDLIWTTGRTKIASQRFADLLASIGATGYRTFPVTVAGRDGQPLGDFIGLAILDADTSRDLYFSTGSQSWSFIAADRVVHALRAAGVTDLSITPVTQ